MRKGRLQAAKEWLKMLCRGSGAIGAILDRDTLVLLDRLVTIHDGDTSIMLSNDKAYRWPGFLPPGPSSSQTVDCLFKDRDKPSCCLTRKLIRQGPSTSW